MTAYLALIPLGIMLAVAGLVTVRPDLLGEQPVDDLGDDGCDRPEF